jgi:hypothetical protein
VGRAAESLDGRAGSEGRIREVEGDVEILQLPDGSLRIVLDGNDD